MVNLFFAFSLRLGAFAGKNYVCVNAKAGGYSFIKTKKMRNEPNFKTTKTTVS